MAWPGWTVPPLLLCQNAETSLAAPTPPSGCRVGGWTSPGTPRGRGTRAGDSQAMGSTRCSSRWGCSLPHGCWLPVWAPYGPVYAMPVVPGWPQAGPDIPVPGREHLGVPACAGAASPSAAASCPLLARDALKAFSLVVFDQHQRAPLLEFVFLRSSPRGGAEADILYPCVPGEGFQTQIRLEESGI